MTTSNPTFPEPDNRSSGSKADVPVAGRIEPAHWQATMDTPPPPALQSAPDLRALLEALKRRWISAACLGITLGAAAAVGAWLLLSPQYTAEAKIQVKYEVENIISMPNGMGGHTDFVTYLRTQAAKIMSSPVINDALKRDEIKRVNLFGREKDPATWILEHLRVDVQEKSEIVGISMASTDPDLSVAVVKAVTEAYMDRCVYADERARLEGVAKIQRAFDDASKELKQRRSELEAFRKSHDIPDPGVANHIMAELQNRLNIDTSQHTTIRIQLASEMARLSALDQELKALKDPTKASGSLELALATDPDYKDMENRLSRLQNLIDDFEYKSPGVAYPTRMRAEELAGGLRIRLEQRRRRVAEKLAGAAATGGANPRDGMHSNRLQVMNTIKSLEGLSSELEKEIKKISEQLARMKVEVPDQDSLYEKIQTQQKTVEKLHEQLSAEKVNLQADKRISVFQNAELQRKDIKKQLVGLVGAPLGVMLAVCAGLAFSEYRQRRIRSASEISRGLGIRVVGAVPDVPDLERHLIGPNGEPDLEGHPVLESFDAIRTLLLRNGHANRIVLVTSAVAGEGKTTLASHLAGSLARAGRKTLLIDGDLRSPAAHQLFELPMQPGFSEVLLSEVELADAIQPTALDGLSFIAAGQWDREVLYALARDGLEGLFEKLLGEFDCIVIDSHPVLSATDSLLIGQQVDAVLLSVRRQVSQMPRVYAASQRMSSLGIRVLGAVVNGSDPEEALAVAAPARAVAA